jgi:hypothetical protein
MNNKRWPDGIDLKIPHEILKIGDNINPVIKSLTNEQSTKIANGITVDTTQLMNHPDYIPKETSFNLRDGRWPLTTTEKILIWLDNHYMGKLVSLYYSRKNN